MSMALTTQQVSSVLKKACLASLVLVVVAWLLVPGPQERPLKQPWSAQMPLNGDIALADSDTPNAIGRPLFWKSRALSADAEESGDSALVANQQAISSSFRYVATMLDDGDKFAMVRSSESGLHRLAVGENIDGWKVISIDIGLVVLGSGPDRQELRPPEKSSDRVVSLEGSKQERPSGEGQKKSEKWNHLRSRSELQDYLRSRSIKSKNKNDRVTSSRQRLKRSAQPDLNDKYSPSDTEGAAQ